MAGEDSKGGPHLSRPLTSSVPSVPSHARVCKRGTLQVLQNGILPPPHGITGFPSVISGFSGVTPPVTWEVPPSPLLRGYSDISLLLSAWSTAAPGLPTQKPTSCIARPTRPPTHYKAMPPTTTRQVWAPILEGWGPSLSFKISDWLLKVPPLLIGLALGPGPLFATSPLIGCL